MAGQQDRRHLAALPGARLSVERIFQQAVFKTVLVGAAGCAHHPRQQAHTGVEHGQGGDLAAGQHEIAQANLNQVAGLNDALVQTLVTPTQQDQARAGGPFSHQALIERPAARRQINARPRPVSDRVQGGGGDIGAHNHAAAAAEGRVIDAAMAVAGMGANIDRLQAPGLGGQRLAGER